MVLKERVKELQKRNLSTEEVINIMLYLILCVLPLCIGFSGIDRYYYPKVILLNIISFMLLILMIKDKVKLNKIAHKLYIVFFIWLTFSTINAMNIEKAILGGMWRYEGLITFFSYGVIFIAAGKYFVFNKIGFNLFMGSGLLVSICYIFQSKNIDPLKYIIKDAERMSSFVGNRNFFSSYVLIYLIISILIYIFWNKKKYLMYSCIFFVALTCSLTRGGWISLCLGIVISFFFIVHKKDRIKRMVILLISFFILFTGINMQRNGVFEKRLNTIKTEITETLEEKKVSTSLGSGRMGIYIGAVEMIKARPLLGTGLECFWNGFEKDAPIDIVEQWETQNIIVDKAHNEILHLASTSGIPAALIYISIIVVVFSGLWKKIKDDRIKIIFMAILLYVFQANFNISVVSVAPLFWIMLGIASNTKTIEKI